MADDRVADTELLEEFESRFESNQELLEFILGAQAPELHGLPEADPAFRERLRLRLLERLRRERDSTPR